VREKRIALGIAQVAPLALEAARLFEELSNADRVKEHFVATLSHELRNTICSISGYQSLALDQATGDLSAEKRDLLERAARCTEELNALITATLDLSRFRTKRLPVDWQDVSLAELAAELSSEVQPRLDRGKVDFICAVDPSLPTVRTDRLKLKMVLRNLLGNALKFTERGAIKLEATARNGGVELRVEDTGIGIPEDARAALFEPFRQAHGKMSREKGGAGLGLFIVRRLVDVLAGTVTVQSEVGRGSTFCIWLPLDRSNGTRARTGHRSTG